MTIYKNNLFELRGFKHKYFPLISHLRFLLRSIYDVYYGICEKQSHNFTSTLMQPHFVNVVPFSCDNGNMFWVVDAWEKWQDDVKNVAEYHLGTCSTESNSYWDQGSATVTVPSPRSIYFTEHSLPRGKRESLTELLSYR